MQVTNSRETQGSNAANILQSPGNDAASLKNEFMTLMIAQIKNQDPTKPIESAEYVSQLAQFSQVESLEYMRKNQSSQMVMMENLGIVQSASLIGKSATVPASNLQLGTEPIEGKVFLDNAVEDLTIEVVNQQGQVVHSLKMGAQGKGDIQFAFDPTAVGLAEGKYELKAKATVGESVLIAPTYVKAEIEKIHFSSASGMMMAEMSNGLGIVPVLNISEVS